MAEEDWNLRPLVVHVLESSPTWLIEFREVNKTGVERVTLTQELKLSSIRG